MNVWIIEKRTKRGAWEPEVDLAYLTEEGAREGLAHCLRASTPVEDWRVARYLAAHQCDHAGGDEHGHPVCTVTGKPR